MKGSTIIKAMTATAGIILLAQLILHEDGKNPGKMNSASSGHPGTVIKSGIPQKVQAKGRQWIKPAKQQEQLQTARTSKRSIHGEPLVHGLDNHMVLPAGSTRSGAKEISEPVRGIYVSGYAAGSPNSMKRLRELAGRTEINAMVIDVKDDYGLLTYPSSVKLAKKIGSDRRPLIQEPKKLLQQLHDEGVYVIGRLVVFKDAWLASKAPELALHEKNGRLWRDSKGKAWINPYRKDVWNYNIAIAQEAASLGFDEIQFDYVRFPANGRRAESVINYDSHGTSKAEAIGQFLGQAREQLNGKPVSADVFGLVTSSADDMGIGQAWRTVASQVDTISPMVYPSHYSDGMYGIAQPDLNPSAVIGKAMSDAAARNRYLVQSGIQPAQIRPWLQSFTATWLHPHLNYGEKEVREQIRAAREAGIDQYLLWSPRCLYPLT